VRIGLEGLLDDFAISRVANAINVCLNAPSQLPLASLSYWKLQLSDLALKADFD